MPRSSRMKAGTETGSLINHVMSAPATGYEPKVGDGATVLSWTDRYAGTIIEVGQGFVVWQRDHAKRADRDGMTDCQTYTYTPDPEGITMTFYRQPDGGYTAGRRGGGKRLSPGHRSEHYDFSF